jgi:replication initiation and membrane attachment protein DnaB
MNANTIIQIHHNLFPFDKLDLEQFSKVPVRLAASLVGQIVSMSYVLGNVTNIMTKYTFSKISAQHSPYPQYILSVAWQNQAAPSLDKDK